MKVFVSKRVIQNILPQAGIDYLINAWKKAAPAYKPLIYTSYIEIPLILKYSWFMIL